MISAEHIDLFQQTMLQNRGIALSEGVATDLFQQAKQVIKFQDALQAIAAGQNDAPALARRVLGA
jgi:hypothetical protein